MKSKVSGTGLAALMAIPWLALSTTTSAQTAASAAVDTTFVAKVSQGGRFEVQASTLAQGKATSQDVKDFATKDVEDHDKVNDELKSIAMAQNIRLPVNLKKRFQKKLDKLSALSGPAFDEAYINSMLKIHIKDEAIFATEAQAGANDDWKAFAAKTDQIVKGHIVALNGIKPTLK